MFLFLLVLAQPVLAKGHKHQHLKGIVITSVDAIERKVVLTIEHNHQSLSYSAPLGTTITINEQPAELGQIKPGMHVTGYTESDEHVLSQLDVESRKGG